MADRSSTPLTVEEVFYLATLGGGSFFGKVGSFAPGYAFDAVIVDDSDILHPQPLTARQRLERLLYLGQDQHVVGKYVNGRPVLLFHLPAQKPGRRLDEFLFHIPHSGSGIAV